nr:PREDICTED: uncharacterized protein LOC105667292 [Linepithema humile]
MAAALSRLLSNVGGPSAKVRRLYTNTVQSVSLYGAPIWAGAALASRQIKQLLYQQQRRLAIRIARAYCTVSYVAATALAGLPSAELFANSYAEVYWRTRDPNRAVECQPNTRGHEQIKAASPPQNDGGLASLHRGLFGWAMDHPRHPALSTRVGGQEGTRNVVPFDAGAHRTRVFRRVPVSNWKRAHDWVPPLCGWSGLGATHPTGV